jgi:P27 family predicted phage terminase small subunit
MMPRKTALEHALEETRSQAGPDAPIPSGRPRCPKELTKESRKTFRETCRLLEARRALTSGDGPLLLLYVRVHERYRRALAKVEDEGEVCIYTRLSSSGEAVQVEKENLWLGILQDCESRMCSILDRLGLSPMNRTKVRPAVLKPKVKAKSSLPMMSIDEVMKNRAVQPDQSVS